MKQLSLKWKLYLIANYVQLAAFGIIALLGSYVLLTSASKGSSEGAIYTTVFIIVLFVMTANNVLNVYTVHRYFPDIINPLYNRVLIIISGIINIFLLAGFLFTLIRGLQDLLSYPLYRTNVTAVFLICFYLTIGITYIFTLILQFRVSAYLAKNNANKINSLISSIGNDPRNADIP